MGKRVSAFSPTAIPLVALYADESAYCDGAAKHEILIYNQPIIDVRYARR
jgi:hypothetical protein